MSTIGRFRKDAKLSKLHPTERFLLGIVTVHLCFLPWALGAMHVWSQCVSFGLSTLSICTSLFPRNYSDEFSGEKPPFRLILWPKLLKFPIFWIGVAFLLYILAQALNPAWRYVQNDQYWWLVKVPHITWLPHGMKTPFAKASPWRSLVVYGSTWMTVCAIWAGFTRRKTLRIFFTALACNAFALALLGIAERALYAEKIFWFWTPPASYFVSSFVYKNHAGAYFNLMLSLCAALAAWHHARSRRRMERSSPSGLFAFFVVILALIVIFSYSRAATILMIGYLGFVLLLVLGRIFMSTERSRNNRSLLAMLFTLFGGLILSGLYFLPTGEAMDRMGMLIKSYQSASPSDRRVATEATLDMFRDSPILGWGGGSFRFAFPIYQRRYPQILSQGKNWFYWEHAHDDYAELLAEFGVFGGAILLTGGIYGTIALFRRRFWRNSVSLLIMSGCGVTLLHCMGDFNFFNPAILITWCAFWFTAMRWAEWDKKAEI